MSNNEIKNLFSCVPELPECCKSCDVYKFGFDASYCDDCNGSVCFYLDVDEEIDWGEE